MSIEILHAHIKIYKREKTRLARAREKEIKCYARPKNFEIGKEQCTAAREVRAAETHF